MGSNGHGRFDNGNYEIELYPQPPWYFGAVGIWSNLFSTDDRLERPREPPDGFADTITVVEKLGSTSSLAVQHVLALQMKLCIGHEYFEESPLYSTTSDGAGLKAPAMRYRILQE